MKLKDLSKKQLIDMIGSYDQYIIDASNENLITDWCPVCIDEYLNNDYTLKDEEQLDLEYSELSKKGTVKLLEDYSEYIQNNDYIDIATYYNQHKSDYSEYVVDLTEVAANIVEVFEDVLQEHNISLSNSDDEDDEFDEDDLDEESKSILFGSEYYAVEDDIKTILMNFM